MRFRVLLLLAIVAIVIANLLILQTAAARPAAATESSDQLLQTEEESNIPIIDLNGPDPNHNYTTTFTENEGPKPIVASTMTVSDTDSTKLKSALVILTNRLDGDDEFLEIDTRDTGITANYDPNTGKLQLSQTDTISNYQKVLSTITYNNLSESPADADRTITFQLFDGANYGNEATSKVLIEAVNDAPVLHNSYDFRLSDIEEDDSNQFGNRVATLIDPAETGGEDRITDPDINSMEGIAVISVDSANGSWQFSTDAGTSWHEFGLLSNSTATLLDPSARIRFVPNLNYHGSTNLSIRAWDQTSGSNGDTDADVSENGGTTAFSSATVTVNLDVLAVNDPPIPDLNGIAPGSNLVIYYLLNSGPVPIASPQGAVEDVDNGELVSAIVTLKTRPDGADEFLNTDLVSPRISIAPYDPKNGELRLNGSAPLAEYNEILRSIVYNNNSDSPSLVDRVIEFTANDGLDNGPTSSTTLHLLTTNNAPRIVDDTPLNLIPIYEDDEDPSGNSVGEIIDSAGTEPIQDDEGALEGLAIVGATAGNGQWQYSVDAGTSWQNIYDVSDASAVLLNLEALLRFLPDKNASGFTRELTVRAWDQTAGVIGSKEVDVTLNGGVTAISEGTLRVSVEIVAVNDPPILQLAEGITAVFTEDNGPVNVVGPALDVVDVDSETLKSAAISITNHQINDADVLGAAPNGSGIAVSYSPETGILSLIGNATVAEYQAILRNVTFENRSHDPATHDRIVTFIVTDVMTSSNIVSSTVKVDSVNDLPLVDLNGVDSPGKNVSVQFDQSDWGGSAVSIASDLDLQDLDDSSLIAATVKLVERPDGEAEYLDANTDGTNITAVYYPESGQLRLTGIESLVNYERVLRTVTYTNTQDRPLTKDRLARFTVRDHEGQSENATSRIVVTPKLVMLPIFLNIEATLPESDEPNDTCQEAFPININTPYHFLAEDKNDWYLFNTNSTSDVTVKLTNYEPVEGQILVARGHCDTLELVGHNGDFSPNKTIELDNLDAGGYYIWIITDKIHSGREPYKYDLSVEVQ